MVIGYLVLLPFPPINIPPIVLETSKNWETAMDLSVLGVPPARGAGHKAISQGFLANSTTICSNYFALSKVCVWTSILSRGYTIKGSGMRFNLERTRRPEWKVGGGVPRRQRGLMGLGPSTKSQLPSLRMLTQTNHGFPAVRETEGKQMPRRSLFAYLLHCRLPAKTGSCQKALSCGSVSQ